MATSDKHFKKLEKIASECSHHVEDLVIDSVRKLKRDAKDEFLDISTVLSICASELFRSVAMNLFRKVDRETAIEILNHHLTAMVEHMSKKHGLTIKVEIRE